LPPFCFWVNNYYVTFKRQTLARIYAAKFLAKNDVLWAAEELYSIMEESIQYDSKQKQDLTKEFLVDIIEIMNNIDEEYTAKITAEYLKLTMELAGVKK
jgi:hypothetical protein